MPDGRKNRRRGGRSANACEEVDVKLPFRWLTVIGFVALVGGLVTLSGPLPLSAQTNTTVQAASNATFGSILVDSQGMTLYTLSSEAGGSIQCTGSCVAAWPPLTISSGSPTAGSGVTGTLGTVTRAEGGTQVTFNGFPLYRFSGDSKAGDTTGEGLQLGSGTWHVVRLATAGAT